MPTPRGDDDAVTKTARTCDVPAELSSDVFIRVIASPVEPLVGRRLALTKSVVVGRYAAAEIDLAIDDPTISRRHAVLELRDGWVDVRDEGSRNGTFVAGERGKRFRVNPPGLVRVGDTLLEIDRGPPDARFDHPDQDLVGESAAVRRLRSQIQQVATSTLPVLLLGETGSGKDVVARAIHARSGRQGSLVAANAAAIPASLAEAHLFGHVRGAFSGADQARDGLFGAAAGGTLFLDEIAELPLELQPKLLRVLDAFEYTRVGSTEVIPANVRIIAATNADLSAEASAGTFRTDLYGRLAGTVLHVPPLRARRGDVPALARRFFSECDPPIAPQWTASFVEALALHPWTMNVRELRMVVRRLATLGEPVLHLHHLKQVLTSRPDAARPEPPDRETLERLLAAHAGNVSNLARSSGWHVRQLYRWFDKLGIDPSSFRRG